MQNRLTPTSKMSNRVVPRTPKATENSTPTLNTPQNQGIVLKRISQNIFSKKSRNSTVSLNSLKQISKEDVGNIIEFIPEMTPSPPKFAHEKQVDIIFTQEVILDLEEDYSKASRPTMMRDQSGSFALTTMTSTVFEFGDDEKTEKKMKEMNNPYFYQEHEVY